MQPSAPSAVATYLALAKDHPQLALLVVMLFGSAMSAIVSRVRARFSSAKPDASVTVSPASPASASPAWSTEEFLARFEDAMKRTLQAASDARASMSPTQAAVDAIGDKISKLQRPSSDDMERVRRELTDAQRIADISVSVLASVKVHAEAVIGQAKALVTVAETMLAEAGALLKDIDNAKRAMLAGVQTDLIDPTAKPAPLPTIDPSSLQCLDPEMSVVVDPAVAAPVESAPASAVSL